MKGMYMDRALLKEVVLEQKQARRNFDLGIKRIELNSIKRLLDLPHTVIISGMRRVGKSTFLAQIADNFFKEGVYYFNFEDERLVEFDTADFNNLYELLLEIEGEKKCFFFDEIQNVRNWELFVRRMQDKGHKFFITGSNASLLSKEFGTRLTGRYVMLELYPFSFIEFLRFNKREYNKDMLLYTKERAIIKRYFSDYIKTGGMPEYLKYQNASIIKRVYEDILYRDIVARYDIKEVKTLRELGLYFLSNIGSVFSYNRLKNMLGLGSSNTIKSYVNYLEDTFLIFTLNRFSYSLRQQIAANKKVYCIDNGIAESVAFSFSKNTGKFLENLVFIELKRRFKEIYYYKTRNAFEVDFLIRKSDKDIMLIQVTNELQDKKVRDREINSMITAMEELKVKRYFVLTNDNEENIKIKDKQIFIEPVYKWLLQNPV